MRFASIVLLLISLLACSKGESVEKECFDLLKINCIGCARTITILDSALIESGQLKDDSGKSFRLFLEHTLEQGFISSPAVSFRQINMSPVDIGKTVFIDDLRSKFDIDTLTYFKSKPYKVQQELDSVIEETGQFSPTIFIPHFLTNLNNLDFEKPLYRLWVYSYLYGDRPSAYIRNIPRKISTEPLIDNSKQDVINIHLNSTPKQLLLNQQLMNTESLKSAFIESWKITNKFPLTRLEVSQDCAISKYMYVKETVEGLYEAYLGKKAKLEYGKNLKDLNEEERDVLRISEQLRIIEVQR